MTSQDGIDITNRFFQAIDELKSRKTIRGLGTFTKRYHINRWNLITVRNNPSITTLKPEYIAYLTQGYGISSEWILLGKGPMFKAERRYKLVQVEER